MKLWTTIVRDALAVSALLFLLSGLDDLFIDVYFYVRRTYRRLFVERKYPKLSEGDLRRVEEKTVAVFIPAWDEQAVIGEMLRNTLRTVDYSNYEIFVGTYPNDIGTMLAVASVQEQDPRVHRIVCPHDGPTCKADCLNWVIEALHLHERALNKHFDIVVIHDSEDIVHPLSLKLMNYLIPRFDMVQLPVVPLEMPYRNMTAGTYLDEFAEFHTKDLLVRERVSGMIPSAGVGTGFSRAALDDLAETTHKQLFNVDTLTEDYDIGFRLKALGKRSILVQFAAERTRVVRKGLLRKREALVKVAEHVATREFFPGSLREAVRQKSRWVYGIVFQGWKQIGWADNARMNYMIWRDRKALLVNVVNISGYVVLVLLTLNWLWFYFHGGAASDWPVLVAKGTWLWYVIVADTFLMFQRMAQRALAVHRVANWRQAALSVPRVLWGNWLNFLAVVKAFDDYRRAMIGKEPVTWRKTAHAFPTEQQLLTFKRKLGDLLLENRMLTLARLTHAMEVQKQTGEKLGEVLTRLGYVQEEDLTSVLSSQMKVDKISLKPGEIARTSLIPESVAREHLIVLVSVTADEAVIAAENPASPAMKQWLEHNIERKYRLVLGGRKNILEAIESVYGTAKKPRALLGELLLESGVITADQLETALAEQKRTGRRLGEVLESFGWVTASVLEENIRRQQKHGATLAVAAGA